MAPVSSTSPGSGAIDFDDDDHDDSDPDWRYSRPPLIGSVAAVVAAVAGSVSPGQIHLLESVFSSDDLLRSSLL